MYSGLSLRPLTAPSPPSLSWRQTVPERGYAGFTYALSHEFSVKVVNHKTTQVHVASGAHASKVNSIKSYEGGLSMQHYQELEPIALGREEDWDSEEDPMDEFQCGDSLAIAVNHIGGEGFQIKKLSTGKQQNARRRT